MYSYLDATPINIVGRLIDTGGAGEVVGAGDHVCTGVRGQIKSA